MFDQFIAAVVDSDCVHRPPGLPEDFSSKDFRPSSGPYCFMEQLCELHDGLVLEAKGVKEHFWKPFIKKLFHKRVRQAIDSLQRSSTRE